MDWRVMAGMSDVLIHRYSGVDYDLVWDVATTKLPAIGHELARLLDQADG